jgi:phosphopantothenoylcysteine decarboxylase / phosphopantothenate---cysteine ligase
MGVTEELEGRRVLVGVGGSVAAFKACEVVTDLRRLGAEVRVAMTEAATHFVTPTLLRALSGHRVAASMWDDEAAEAGHGMSHLDLASWCEVQVIVAVSADLLARLALGLAGDPVTATALACRAPLLVAPAMEAAMWEHPATQGHAATLTSRGVRILGPVHGRLASGHESTGRMVEAGEIVSAVGERLGDGA